MPTLNQLEIAAIRAAKKANWSEALTINQEILAQNPQNINALNRTGFAYLQLEKFTAAKRYFKQVLTYEKTNLIAQKQLENIKNKLVAVPQFNSQNFVEEPSKSKIIGLHRLAAKQTLESLVSGQELILKPKNRFISVETKDKVYLGALGEDISLQLSRLISTGNRYFCQVHSSSGRHCDVFIREVYQSPENRRHNSFTSTYKPEKEETIGEDLLLLADEVPLSIIDDESEAAFDTPELKDRSGAVEDD